MTSGGREFVKWVALVLMTGDHVNKALLAGAAPWLSDAARLVFPVFAFVLAWGIERGRVGARGRALTRLVVAGVLVQPLHALAFGYWLPGNVLLTLAAGLFVGGRAHPVWRVLVLAVGGLLVDYQWAGVLFVAASCWIIRHSDGWRSWALLALALLPLCWFNGNAWALLALPLLWAFGAMPGDVPRHRHTFLGYYGSHLAILATVAVVIGI